MATCQEQALEQEEAQTLLRFLEHAPSTFSRLRFVELGNTCRKDDDAIADLLGRCTGGPRKIIITEIRDYGVRFGPKSAQALFKHASTLEVIRMENVFQFESERIHRLLCSALNLKELHLIGDRRDADETKAGQDARDMVKSDWVCLSLEVFGCEIFNIIRPDISRTIEGDAPIGFVVEGTHEESIALQRSAYEQLGRLTKLRELSPGVPCVVAMKIFRRYDCLAMTLKRGLDLLKNLKGLRIVGLEDSEVYIGRDKEQEWVTKNWPKINDILQVTDNKMPLPPPSLAGLPSELQEMCAAIGALKTNGHLIESLKVECYNDFLEMFLQLAPPSFAQLTSAELVDCTDRDYVIADFTLDLEEYGLGVYDYVDFGPDSNGTLLEHTSTLKVFRLEGALWFRSEDIQRLLFSASQLKELRLLSMNHRAESEDCSLDAADAIESDWAW
ncbi:hypothetical protein BGX33_007435 [Mortierella sp. NVP41]|nr:hypothetical protein BGX33_007435 [Mortierella sp. NVP41]